MKGEKVEKGVKGEKGGTVRRWDGEEGVGREKGERGDVLIYDNSIGFLRVRESFGSCCLF